MTRDNLKAIKITEDNRNMKIQQEIVFRVAHTIQNLMLCHWGIESAF